MKLPQDGRDVFTLSSTSSKACGGVFVQPEDAIQKAFRDVKQQRVAVVQARREERKNNCLVLDSVLFPITLSPQYDDDLSTVSDFNKLYNTDFVRSSS